MGPIYRKDDAQPLSLCVTIYNWKEGKFITMNAKLKIFIAQDCPNCAEARAIAAHVEDNYPALTIEIIDIADDEAIVPDTVFATPTFMLNDRVVSLGNPNLEQVAQWAEKSLTTVGS